MEHAEHTGKLIRRIATPDTKHKPLKKRRVLPTKKSGAKGTGGPKKALPKTIRTKSSRVTKSAKDTSRFRTVLKLCDTTSDTQGRRSSRLKRSVNSAFSTPTKRTRLVKTRQASRPEKSIKPTRSYEVKAIITTGSKTSVLLKAIRDAEHTGVASENSGSASGIGSSPSEAAVSADGIHRLDDDEASPPRPEKSIEPPTDEAAKAASTPSKTTVWTPIIHVPDTGIVSSVDDGIDGPEDDVAHLLEKSTEPPIDGDAKAASTPYKTTFGAPVGIVSPCPSDAPALADGIHERECVAHEAGGNTILAPYIQDPSGARFSADGTHGSEDVPPGRSARALKPLVDAFLVKTPASSSSSNAQGEKYALPAGNVFEDFNWNVDNEEDPASSISSNEATESTDVPPTNIRSEIKFDREIYDAIKAGITANPDFNHQDEYVCLERNGGTARMALGTPALMRVRLKKILKIHEEHAWWKDLVKQSAEEDSFCIEHFVALAVVMYDVTDWSLSELEVNDFTSKFNEEDDILFIGQSLADLWERINRSLSRDTHYNRLVFEGMERGSAIHKMIGILVSSSRMAVSGLM